MQCFHCKIISVFKAINDFGIVEVRREVFRCPQSEDLVDDIHLRPIKRVVFSINKLVINSEFFFELGVEVII